MSRNVFCVKLNQDAEGLNFAPYPGELGKRIYDHISKAAWSQWLAHQTMAAAAGITASSDAGATIEVAK